MRRLPLLFLGLCICGTCAADLWSDMFQQHLQAAEAGDVQAQYEVANNYLRGRGTEPDREQAVFWLQKAADQGHALAASKLKRMDHFENRFDDILAAAELGDADAQYDLGVMYMKGSGTQLDYGLARRWLSRASKQGNAQASTKLGYLYLKGLGMDTDPAQAREHLLVGADHGIALAYYYLGELHAESDTPHYNPSAALDWYRKADAGGVDQAKSHILDIEEEIQMAQREAARQQQLAAIPAPTPAPAPAPAPILAKTTPTSAKAAPVPAKPAATPRSPLARLASSHWQRDGNAVDFLPSAVARCEPEKDTLVCLTRTLERGNPPYQISYKVKSIMEPLDTNRFTIRYRNLVLGVREDEAIDHEDEILGYDGQREQGFQVTTGWTKEHQVECRFSASDRLDCTKDRYHQLEILRVAGDS